MALIQFSKSRWVDPEQVLHMSIKEEAQMDNVTLVVVTSVDTKLFSPGFSPGFAPLPMPMPMQLPYSPRQEPIVSGLYTISYNYPSLAEATKAATNIEKRVSIL